MSKQSKAAFAAALSTYIEDNNIKSNTPARHRTVETNMADSVGWLEDANTWEAVQTLQSLLRYSVEVFDGTATETISTKNLNVITAGTTTVNLPASPTAGDWFKIKNRSGGDVTLAGNGNNLYNYASASSITMIDGAMVEVYYDGTYWNVN